MTIALIVNGIRESSERIREEEGDQAARDFEARALGSILKSGGGGMAGAIIGSSILPGVSTAIGNAIAFAWSAVSRRTAGAENVNTLVDRWASYGPRMS